MTIKLHIEVESPLTPDDRDLLAGIAVMTVAIANRELGVQTGPEETPPGPEPQPCGDREAFEEPGGPDYTGRVCISPVGHAGRHKYRHPDPLSDPLAAGLVN